MKEDALGLDGRNCLEMNFKFRTSRSRIRINPLYSRDYVLERLNIQTIVTCVARLTFFSRETLQYGICETAAVKL